MNFKYTPNTLKKLEQLFEEAHYMIRYEKGNFNSGYCVMEYRKIAVINKFLDTEGRINALLDILPTISIVKESLSDDMLKLYNALIQQSEQKTQIK